LTTYLTAIAGLGNPEERHARTLHNAGFWFVDELARRAGAQFRYEKRFDADTCRVSLFDIEIWLVKPQSYMNLSGGPLRSVLDYYRLAVSDLLVAHDEIDLDPGTVRLKKGGGHGGHNGLRDVIKHTGSDFMRLRIGVGHPGHKDLVTDYVLKRATDEVEQAMSRNIDDAADVMPLLAADGIEAAMTRLHTKPEA
jgi:peptidyl-tRNA hydrolase, PTH1 family